MKAKKKQGIGHIQSSMQNLISRLGEGRNLADPISSSSDSGDSVIIDIKIPNIVEETRVSDDLDEKEDTDADLFIDVVDFNKPTKYLFYFLKIQILNK